MSCDDFMDTMILGKDKALVKSWLRTSEGGLRLWYLFVTKFVCHGKDVTMKLKMEKLNLCNCK